MSETFTYPNPGSEYGEDRWIEENLVLPKTGFYVDIGAMRPNALSNTWFLRQRGWHGLAIDGHPECAEHWKGVPGAVFLWLVVSDKTKLVAFDLDRDNGPCARIVPASSFPPPRGEIGEMFNAVSLGDALLGVRQVDFLSIDIEGEEYAAMTTFPFDRLRPGIIVAEYATLQPDGSVKEDLRLRELLLTKGYKEVHRTVANIVFVTT